MSEILFDFSSYDIFALSSVRDLIEELNRQREYQKTEEEFARLYKAISDAEKEESRILKRIAIRERLRN